MDPDLLERFARIMKDNGLVSLEIGTIKMTRDPQEAVNLALAARAAELGAKSKGVTDEQLLHDPMAGLT